MMRAQDFDAWLVTGETFDLHFYVDEISRARVTSQGMAKYGEMRN